MTHTQIIIIFITLLVIGLSLSANNLIHSLVVNLFLYNDSLSKTSVRIMGIMLLLSSILFIFGAYDICLIIISIILTFFTFLVIRGKTKSFEAKQKKKQELINLHQAEIDAKMQRIQQLRDKLEVNQQTKTTGKIARMKRSKWDDGSPTSKEMIEEFNK